MVATVTDSDNPCTGLCLRDFQPEQWPLIRAHYYHAHGLLCQESYLKLIVTLLPLRLLCEALEQSFEVRLWRGPSHERVIAPRHEGQRTSRAGGSGLNPSLETIGYGTLCAYRMGLEPVTRISTSLLALCCQSGLVVTLATPTRARSRSIASRSFRMSPLLIARFTRERIASCISA